MPLVLDRYPLVYRSSIVSEVMSATERGDSVCLVGLAGSGKSNLAHFLEVATVVRHYLPSSIAERTHFRHIELTAEISTDQIYASMVDAVSQAAAAIGAVLPTRGAEESTLAHLRALLGAFCADAGQRIVFIFDEFEVLLRSQPPHFLQDLRKLRDDHRTSRNVVFLIITHRMPQIVRRQPLIQPGGKFLEIFENHIYALPPYSASDAQSMIDALARRYGLDPGVPGPEQRDMLYHLSGGHSNLLAQAFTVMQPTFKKSLRRVVNLAEKAGPMRTACEHIWQHLHREEQEALALLAEGQQIEAAMLEFLHKRGLIHIQPNLTFFSPIFLAYVHSRPKP